MDYYRLALAIALKEGYVACEGYVLKRMGLVYRSLGNLAKTTEFLEEALKRHRQVGSASPLNSTLHNWAVFKSELGETDGVLSRRWAGGHREL